MSFGVLILFSVFNVSPCFIGHFPCSVVHFSLIWFLSCLGFACSHTLAIVVVPTRGNPAKGVLVIVHSWCWYYWTSDPPLTLSQTNLFLINAQFCYSCGKWLAALFLYVISHSGTIMMLESSCNHDEGYICGRGLYERKGLNPIEKNQHKFTLLAFLWGLMPWMTSSQNFHFPVTKDLGAKTHRSWRSNSWQ